jgi:hypothetical protein
MPARDQDRYAVLPEDEDLQPRDPVHGVRPELQAKSMRELRALHNAIPRGQMKRDRQMQAWALSNSLSRQDMARAVGISKSRVDQIIRELTLHDQAVTTKRLMEQMRRHMTDEQYAAVLRQQAQYGQQLAEDDEGLGGVI